MKNIIKYLLIKSRILKLIGVDEQKYRQRFLYYKYSKKFKKQISSFQNKNGKPKRENYIYIWIYWDQELRNAPRIIKACINSVKKNLANTYPNKYRLMLLDKNNIKQFVHLPDFIEKKFQQNTISIAHYSDILRTYLLVKYGGYWIDSTVFIFSRTKLFDVIEKQNLFVFKWIDLSKNYYSKQYISNWFIFSQPNNNILTLTLDLLYLYWKSNNNLEDYFIYHTLFSIATDKYRNEFDAIPTYNNCSPHILQFEMFDEYRPNRFLDIMKVSPIQKLNRAAKPNSKKRLYTFNDYIIKNFSN